MGTLFEPAFGSFPGMDSYGSGSFMSFGPPVDFVAGCGGPEQWQNKRRCLRDERSPSSDTPELSSRPSSCNSSRPSSFHFDSQSPFHGSSGEAELYQPNQVPYILNCDTLNPEPPLWAGSSGQDNSCWPQEYSLAYDSDFSLYHQMVDRALIHPYQNVKTVPKDVPSDAGAYGSITANEAPEPTMGGMEELTNINKLAAVLEKVGEYDEAETMLRQTLRLGEALLGKQHPYTLLSIENLARLLYRGGQYNEAAALYNRVCHVYQESLGPDHPITLNCMDNYSLALEKVDVGAVSTLQSLSGSCITSPGLFSDAMLQSSSRSRSSSYLSTYTTYPYPTQEPDIPSHASKLPPSSPYAPRQSADKLSGQCPNPDCGKVFKDLRAHMLTHSNGRREKCPVITCEYHVKGFCREYGKNRHTLTHYKGTMVCGFCRGSGTDAEISFNRADVFKRHLTSVHGVEQTPPSKRKNSKLKVYSSGKGTLAGYVSDATGICSICSVSFQNAQDFYEHLDACVLRKVLKDAPVCADDAFKKEVKGDTSVSETAKEFHDFDSFSSFNDENLSEVKKRKSHSVSWRIPTPKMKKKAMCIYDGITIEPNCSLRIALSRGKSYVTDLDAPTVQQTQTQLPDVDQALANWARNFEQGIALTDTNVKNKAQSFVATVSNKSQVKLATTGWPETSKQDNGIGRNTNTKSPSVDTPSDPGTLAPSPETDISEDLTDNESISDCSTDWGDIVDTSSPGSDVYRVLSGTHGDHTEGEKDLVRPILSPMKQALVDRIMTEFWTIVNQEWSANLTRYAGETPASSSPPGSNGSLLGGSPPQITNKKRERDDGDDLPPDDNNGRTPKRPNSQSERPPPKNGVKFACPYRKHAPHRYTIYKHRSCALSHWDTVARVKEHLYRRHRVQIQCKRCWQPFKTQELLDAHLTVVNICTLQPGQAAEGLTADLEKRLKSRKKSSPDQSEEARWKEIYGMLFPNEVVPNPYFEPVQENAAQSPDSRELADYEEYSRQELPRVFRSYLEDAVNNETQHLEEHIRSQLVNIVQDCQARMLSAYRSKLAGGKSTPIGTGNACATPPSSDGGLEEIVEPSRAESKDIVSSAYRAPTPQNALQDLPDLGDIQALDMPPNITEDFSFSDSAYSSNGTSSSQVITTPPQVRESAVAKSLDRHYDKLPMEDYGSNSFAHDLSFEESYNNITLDMNDPNFDWWINPSSEG